MILVNIVIHLVTDLQTQFGSSETVTSTIFWKSICMHQDMHGSKKPYSLEAYSCVNLVEKNVIEWRLICNLIKALSFS